MTEVLTDLDRALNLAAAVSLQLPSQHELLRLLLLVGTGVIGGWMNSVAGGASLLMFPVLVALGLEPRSANATNNFATTLVTLQASADFARRGFSNRELAQRLAPASILGAIAGAWGVVVLSAQDFTRIVAVLMIVALGLVLYNPKRKGLGLASRPQSAHEGQLRARIGQGIFVLLGIYGGFFGGGIGMLITPVLVYFYQQDYVTATGVRTLLTGLMNLVAMGLFLYYGLIEFTMAIPLAIGTALGGWIGVRHATKGGEAFIRPVLIGVTSASVIKFLFFS